MLRRNIWLPLKLIGTRFGLSSHSIPNLLAMSWRICRLNDSFLLEACSRHYYTLVGEEESNRQQRAEGFV